MDKALKQRLVGASVLIALAVIILPMLLGGRPEGDNRQTRTIELPAQPPELSFETRRYPIGDQASTAEEKTDESVPKDSVRKLPAPKTPVSEVSQPDEGASSEQPQTVEPAQIVEPAQMPEESSPAPAPIEETPDSGRYLVQVASFGAMDNANKLASRLRSDGYLVVSDSVKSDVGTLHRVRVGPYGSQAEAAGIAAELELKVSGVKPRVMDLQPGKSAQITTPSDPLIRWIVQVGSFTSAGNAEKLVASLRLEGLSAYQETINNSGSTIYRVRIGPFLERAEALSIEQRVRKQRSLNGVVMSAD